MDIPGPNNLVRPIVGRWQRPEDGLLGGEIIKIESAQSFLLKTQKGDNWKVFYSADTEIKRRVEMKEGEMVDIVGEKKGEYVFGASAIRQAPLGGPRARGMQK